MTVTLTAEQGKFIAEQLKNGHYRSADDGIAQSLGMMRAQEDFIRSNVAVLRGKIAAGMEQIGRSEVVDGKEVFRNLRKKLQARRSQVFVLRKEKEKRPPSHWNTCG